MKKKVIILTLFAAAMMFTLTGCLPSSVADEAASRAGFFWGIWHGMIAPISLIASLFNPSYSIYEANNAGFWYNLGFYLAIGGEFLTINIFGGCRRRSGR
jgi:hypothetical protein